MSAASTTIVRYVPTSDRQPKISAVSPSKSEPERRLWKISAAICKKSDGDWIYFIFFGVLASLATAQTFTTLFQLFDTDALTDFVANALRSAARR